MNDGENLKVYKGLILASALIYLIASFILLQSIITYCQSVRKQITRYNLPSLFKSQDFPFLYRAAVYSKQQLYSTLILWPSAVGMLFWRVHKVSNKLGKE